MYESMAGDRRISPKEDSNHNVKPFLGLTARIANTPDLLKQAWSLRYAAYSSRGFIDDAPSCLFKDEWDDYPSTTTVLVYKDEIPAATARLCLYAPGSGIPGADAIPAMDVFRSEIVDTFQKIHGFSRGAEIMRLSKRPGLGGGSAPVLAVFEVVGCLLLHLGVDVVICAVRKHHAAFYKRLGFATIGAPRQYPKLKFETVLMAYVPSDRHVVLSQVESNLTEKIRYQDLPASPERPVLGTRWWSPKPGGMLEIRSAPGEVRTRIANWERSPARVRKLQVAA